MKTMTLLLTLALSAPLAAATSVSPYADADTPAISFRPFLLAAGQEFAAKTTFGATFGRAFQPFWGGGVEVVLRDGIWVDLTVSMFSKNGQRAFVNNGRVFSLGIPLTATVTPIEVSGGYRFRISKRLIPYFGAGVGSYAYTEHSSFADPDENVDTRHAGYLVVGGAELRVHRWIGVAADAQYTYVGGILGSGGLSQLAGEKSLGGLSARLRLVVGR